MNFREYQNSMQENTSLKVVMPRTPGVNYLIQCIIEFGKLSGAVKKLYRDNNPEKIVIIRSKLLKLVQLLEAVLEEIPDRKKFDTTELDDKVYPFFGAVDEIGELLEKLILGFSKDDLEKEAGDVLWYVQEIHSRLGLDLQDSATNNVDKLLNRAVNNKIRGDGDNR